MTEEVLSQDELATLKERADQMGINYHPSIGVDKLREKINAALEGQGVTGGDAVETAAPVDGEVEGETPAQFKQRKKKEASALVRVRVTCMNPNKKDWDGEIFTVSNALVGTFKKMVPFDTEWHVPRMILNMIKARKCQIFQTVRAANGQKIRKGKLVPEFAVEELPPLTEAELKDLAQRQAMAKGNAE